MTTDSANREDLNQPLDRYVKIARRMAAAWCALAAGLVFAASWGSEVTPHAPVPAGAAYVRVDTAIGLLLLGAALWENRRWRDFRAAAGGLAALTGFIALIGYAGGWSPLSGWQPEGMVLAAAICFSLVGSGLALSAAGRAIFAIQWLALPAAAVSMAVLTGYIYGGVHVYGSGSILHMAAPTALALLAAAIALLFSHPDRGAMRIVLSRGPGGWTARCLLPAAILIPPLLEWLRSEADRLGYCGTAGCVVVFASANAIVFTALILANARMLNRTDARRVQAEGALRASEESFRALLESTPDAMIVTDQEGAMILVNAQAETLFGYTRAEMLGEPIEKLIPHAARARHRDYRAAYGAAPRTRPMHASPMDFRGLRKDGTEFCAGVSLNTLRTPDGMRVVCAVRDSTARQLAELALRESEARFRQLADAMPQIVWTATPDGNVDYLNQRWFDYTGLPIEESRNLAWQAVLHPEDVPNCNERRNRAFAAGEAYEVEYRFRRAADGAYRWHLGRAVPIRNPDGAMARWFGTCTDIDDYKRAEQEIRRAWHEIKSLNHALERRVRERTLQLRDSEDRFRQLVEGVKDYAILMLDPQGCVTTWTDAAERLKGYASAEILGTSFSRFYTAGDVARGHPADVLRAAAHDGNFQEQGWRVRKDGSRFWAEVSITALRDETGNLQGFSKITRDITERKESDQKIRESEEKFRTLLESAPDAVVIADGQGAITLVNAQAERLFGYGRQEMLGQPVEMLLPAGVRGVHAQHCGDYRESASARQMGIGLELSARRKDGQEFPVEVSLSPIKTARGSWVAAAVRDISERKLVEGQLVVARQRAEEANRAKSAFLAAMSHEIRTPMNAIMGMSDLLSETELNDAQRQYVRIFRRAGSNLLNLINNILDFSKIEAGRFDLEQAEFQLRDLVDHTVELVTPKAQAKGITLVSSLNPTVLNRFTGDATRLRQVLINLLGNAIKFTETGEVRLTVQEPQAGPAGHLEFLVSDTGIGIPEGQLEAVFEDFKQGDSSTTRKYGGSGLGLAISRRIAERMGGSLSVASVVGKGSTFRLGVPLQAAPERKDEPQVETTDFHGQRVAIVDSNTTNRLILRETLGGWGLITTEFSSGEQSLEDLTGTPHAQCPYSLIIVDSVVDSRVDGGRSHANGFETAARFRAMFPDLPVIMLSTDDRPCDEARCRENGFLGYAVRPVDRGVLLQLVAKALGCSRTEAAGPAARPEPSATAQRKSLRILVAEDSPDNRLLVQLYLEGGPHSLTFVEHGGEALEQIASTEFDVVLMDVQMPVMDGLAATTAIRAMELERGRRAVPILALSANARPEDIESSLEAGCTAHLSKPISKQRLLTALDEYARELPAVQA
jgi:PAS domain S-box-containing protein